MSDNSKPKIFISYSHQDSHWKEYIKKFFIVGDKFDIWNDKDIELGENWFNEIKENLHEADIAILLISVDFLNSDFIKNEEIPDLLDRCKSNDVRVIVIYVRQVPQYTAPTWLFSPGKSLQGFPSPDTPLETHIENNSDDGLKRSTTLSSEISQLVDKVYGLCHTEILKGLKQELKTPYQFIIDYLSECNKNDFLKVCEIFLEKNLYARIKEYATIEEIIVHISEDDKFPCIIKQFFNDDNEELREWLFGQELSQCQMEHEEILDPLLVVIFKLIEKNKYEVTFIAKDLPHMIDESDSFSYDFDVERDKFMNKVMSYILTDVGTCNPRVDLILPLKIMLEDINLWEANFNDSLSRLAKTNIRYYARYNSNADMKEKILIPQWNKIKDKVENGNSLKCIVSEENIREIGSNMEYCGVSSKFILEHKDIQTLLKTDMSYIMIWLTDESNKNLQELYENVNCLQEKYYECNADPISLMWDDPNTYYYPDQKGE